MCDEFSQVALVDSTLHPYLNHPHTPAPDKPALRSDPALALELSPEACESVSGGAVLSTRAGPAAADFHDPALTPATEAGAGGGASGPAEQPHCLLPCEELKPPASTSPPRDAATFASTAARSRESPGDEFCDGASGAGAARARSGLSESDPNNSHTDANDTVTDPPTDSESLTESGELTGDGQPSSSASAKSNASFADSVVSFYWHRLKASLVESRWYRRPRPRPRGGG
jgi:hypothetical protein